MLKTTARALAVAALALAAGLPGTAQAEKQAREAPIFSWSMPRGFGVEVDEEGRIVETQPYEVRHGPWTVNLKVTGPACVEGAAYRWSVDGKRVRPQRLGPCRFARSFPSEGARTVRLDAWTGKAHLTRSRKVVVQDWLIVSIGDSVASGEGVPDVPGFADATWQSVRCHRSARAGVALAAKTIEEDDSHSSVTFVHLACSGAEVPMGLLGPYAGAVPPHDEPPLEPQVPILNRIARVRPVDAVLLSIGANDIHFSDVVTFCARPARDCFDRPPPKSLRGSGARTVREAVGDSLLDLGAGYRALAGRISPRIPASRVHIVEYFDPTRNAQGRTCGRILGAITEREVEQAQSRILAPLNSEMRKAALAHGWDLVGGVARLFRNHGYCAGRQAWVGSLLDSLLNLGGLTHRYKGTLHPNMAGHEAASTLISSALERDLYPGRVFPPRPLPEPALEDDSWGAVEIAVAVVLALSVLLGSAAVVVLSIRRR